MSVIIDGMDQKKTCLPHWPEEATTVSSLEKVKTHVVGARMHGIGNNAFIDCNQYPHDSNLTITVLLQSLLMMEKLPPVLYLQLDNTSRENKNRSVTND